MWLVAATPCGPTGNRIDVWHHRDVSIRAASPLPTGFRRLCCCNEQQQPHFSQQMEQSIISGDNRRSVISGARKLYCLGPPLTTYYFFIFSMNNVCTGGPVILHGTVLNGQATAPLQACHHTAALTRSVTNLIRFSGIQFHTGFVTLHNVTNGAAIASSSSVTAP